MLYRTNIYKLFWGLNTSPPPQPTVVTPKQESNTCLIYELQPLVRDLIHLRLMSFWDAKFLPLLYFIWKQVMCQTRETSPHRERCQLQKRHTVISCSSKHFIPNHKDNVCGEKVSPPTQWGQ